MFVQVTAKNVGGVFFETQCIMLRTLYFYLSNVISCAVRFLCVMRVFEVRASSSSPRLPLCQISFFPDSIAELAHEEKLRTQSLTHSINQSPSLLNAPGTEACASEQKRKMTTVIYDF